MLSDTTTLDSRCAVADGRWTARSWGAWLAAFALLVGGCTGPGTPPGGDPGGDPTADAGPGGPPPPSDDPPPPPGQSCEEVYAESRVVMNTYCAGCHAGGNSIGGFGAALDAPAMISSGKIVPGSPDESRIYIRMSDSNPASAMPPPSAGDNRPDDRDLEVMHEWIGRCDAESEFDDDPGVGGAPFISINDMLDAMSDDLRDVTNPADREEIRYVTLTHLSNAGASSAQMEIFRAAMQLALNSLSRGRNVTPARAIDEYETIFRIELDDYVWDEDTWEEIVSFYPYHVRYDEDSFLFPFDEDTADEIRDETGAEVPFVQGDWFVFQGMQPPLYYDILELPETLQGLEALLGIDTQEEREAERVDRAGFIVSGVSSANRMMERFELPGAAGSFWVSCDFADNGVDQSIFDEPINPPCDGGEMIFNLPNGLQGYYIATNEGVRLDAAPQAIVTDPTRDDNAVLAGISCAGGCHNAAGIIPKDDEVLEYARTNLGGAELEEVLSLYPGNRVLAELFEEDQDRFIRAREIIARSDMDQPLNQTSLNYDTGFNLARAAAILGIPSEDLLAALNANSGAFPPQMVSLRNPRGLIFRETFEEAFADTVCALGLGEPCDPLDANDCSCD